MTARATRPLVLDVAGLDAFHGRAQAIFAVDLQMASGQVVALLGRNGAGKSTILKAIAGLVTRRARRLELNGVDALNRPTYQLARAGLGYVPEDRRIFTDLTVEENLETGRQPSRPGAPEWTPERLFELFPNLAEMRGRSARQMSGGEQQMLTIARTLMGNPRLLLLDEPSEGLSPRIVELMARAIDKLKDEGLAILVSEQNLRFARFVSDAAVVVERGSVCFSGSLVALETDEAAQRGLRAV
jgi:branched-chain amino acid transport system ATP-binding protein